MNKYRAPHHMNMYLHIVRSITRSNHISISNHKLYSCKNLSLSIVSSGIKFIPNDGSTARIRYSASADCWMRGSHGRSFYPCPIVTDASFVTANTGK